MREPLNGGRREPLIFWTAYGAESLLCTVSAPTRQRPPLVLVCVAGAEEEPKPRWRTPDGGGRPIKRRRCHPEKDRARHPHRLRRPAAPMAEEDAPGATADREASFEARARAQDALERHRRRRRDHERSALRRHRQRALSRLHDRHPRQRAPCARGHRPILVGGRPRAAGRARKPPSSTSTRSPKAPSPPCARSPRKRASSSGELHAQLPHVIADAMTVKQILFNLLTNAIKFTKRGGTCASSRTRLRPLRVRRGAGHGPGMTAKCRYRARSTSTCRRPAAQEGRRIRHRTTARVRIGEGERSAHRDRQRARRGHGRRTDLPEDRVAAERIAPRRLRFN